jgi:hypothetical protein
MNNHSILTKIDQIVNVARLMQSIGTVSWVEHAKRVGNMIQ